MWFDSGVCHTAVQKKREELGFPADIYIEGSDQHRGWFQTSLVSSLAAYGEPPFKALLTHGFVNDSEGMKMSKSRGNVVDPAEVIKSSGAEILRLWVAYEDYGQDVNAGQEIFQRVTESYRRIRNTLRFLLGNLVDFDPEIHGVEFSHMPPLDQWALIKLNQLVKDVTSFYDSYEYCKVYHTVNHFYTVDLSATYLDILKDRLYTWSKEGRNRRSSQTVFYELLTHLNTLMAPILSFLSEEVYSYIPGTRSPSVFLENFPQFQPAWQNKKIQEQVEKVMEVRSAVSKVLEPMRKDKVIGSSLDAAVTIYAPPTFLEVLQGIQKGQDLPLEGEGQEKGPFDYLREILIVSQVQLQEANELKADEFKVEAHSAAGDKCPRCWHYSSHLGTMGEYEGICPKCLMALGHC